jgi:hypothetical protein
LPIPVSLFLFIFELIQQFCCNRRYTMTLTIE